jgi:hypothetical protein
VSIVRLGSLASLRIINNLILLSRQLLVLIHQDLPAVHVVIVVILEPILMLTLLANASADVIEFVGDLGRLGEGKPNLRNAGGAHLCLFGTWSKNAGCERSLSFFRRKPKGELGFIHSKTTVIATDALVLQFLSRLFSTRADHDEQFALLLKAGDAFLDGAFSLS